MNSRRYAFFFALYDVSRTVLLRMHWKDMQHQQHMVLSALVIHLHTLRPAIPCSGAEVVNYRVKTCSSKNAAKQRIDVERMDMDMHARTVVGSYL